MDCLINLVSSFSSGLVKVTTNELRYFCCFNNLVKDLEKEGDNLIATRDSVQDRVAQANKQARKTVEVIDKWLKDANNDINNVDKLLKRARTKKSCCLGHCPNWIWRYHLGKKLAKKKNDVENCIEKCSKYIPLERVATLPRMQDFPSERCLKFESRQYAYEQLMEALKDDEVVRIGLYGMGGCGKTTLAMEVGKRAEENHLFDKVLFVPVSCAVEVRRIQDKIASALQFDFPKNENEEREKCQRLCMRITQENRILVILDDVWEMLDFDAIGIPSNENHKGCKVLITTRSDDVCKGMDCQRKVRLPNLTDNEAWDLFQKLSHISEGTPQTLKHLARLISNECKGLFVAIAAVASTLKSKADVEWKVALDRLISSKPMNIEKGLQNPYKCLQLSYDNLDTDEAKSLFLLCSVWPEDYEIPVEGLTRYAIGLGLIGELSSYERARNVVRVAKNKLISSCLLLGSIEGNYVKMHDLVRDVAQWIAKKENDRVMPVMEYGSPRCLWCEEFPNELDCSNLEFLYIHTELEVPDKIFNGMRKLKVLLLFNDRMGWPLSMMSFKSLINLRCLVLEGWKLSNITILGDLKKLESLTFRKCSFLELHGVVSQMTNLRLLELLECDMETDIFEVIVGLPQLEELYITDTRSKWDVYNENTIEFFNKFDVPQTLQRYRIKLGTSYEYYTELFFSHHRTLLLPCFHTSNVAIKGLAKKAEVLSIANIQGGAKNVIPDIFPIEGGGMNHLIELVMIGSKEIECLVDTSNNHLSEIGTIFSHLLMLRIESMVSLRALCCGCLPLTGPFKKLEELCLRDCPKLTYLFTPAIAQSLVK
ncbi:P-loop containing nucleoside triphosphate hydrolase [Sesbania bispinosa]|nr:P-loop containing nucleoside triphosphate hydrolase [Sesbania bispinosa]